MRGALRRWQHGRVGLWYHPSFRLPLTSELTQLGIDPRRADDVLTYALDRDLVVDDDLYSPAEVPWAWLERVHSHAWLESLDNADVVAAIVKGSPEALPVASLLETWRRAVGAAVDATRYALAQRRRAMTLLGGFHHAFPDRGAGFCAINDLAVALAVARDDGFTGRCVILDVDAHPPDGLTACVSGDANTIVASLGVASAWTVAAPAVATLLDHRVPAGAGDAAYLTALDALLDAVRDALPSGVSEPDLAFVLAGADPLVGDRLGGLAVTEAGLRERDRRIFAALGGCPTVIVPGGGYTPSAWRVLAGTLAEAAGDNRPIPDDYDPLRCRTGNIARQLDPTMLRGDDAPWFSPEDIAELLGETPKEPRFLGYYTRHGLEHALHHYGILGHLARLGFSDVEVAIQADAEPHALRVTARVRGERATLLDLRASVREVLEHRTLFIEWLELRDPRMVFTPGKPQLPGQAGPGLGLAKETAQLLVRAARRLSLAGVSFVPAHYHIAFMAKKRMTVVEPKHRGQFRAMQRALADVPLAEASRIVGTVGIPTEDGDALRWTPTTMVLAIDPGLITLIAAGERDAKHVEDGCFDRLIPLQRPRQ